jgi:hypothetical protein
LRRYWVSIVVTLLCTSVYADEPVTFSAMGDGPYDVKDWNRLRHQIGHENREAKSRFIIHVGDIASGTDALPESRYTRVAEILQGSDVPLFIIPGDNEWNDLDDPAIGWAYWVKHFTEFEHHFDVSWDVTRQDVRRENFAFVLDGVLFVGINLVGGTVHDAAEWQTRHEQNAGWVREQIESHGNEVRAAVIFGHAQPKEKHETFFSAAVPAIESFGKPTLYLHGDGHFWQKDKRWRVPNLWRVQVDQIGEGPPVRVTVTTKARKPFDFDRQLDERDSDLYEPMSKRIRKQNGFGRTVRPR